jgi:hypothetical protein
MAKGKKEEIKPLEKLERDGSKGKRGICFSLFFVIFFFYLLGEECKASGGSLLFSPKSGPVR